MISWRSLLDSLNISWRDRGANCSRGHVNIQCPWCGRDDPSYHLGIEEATGKYYCFRDRRHGGKSPYYLLRALGAPAIDSLLREYGSDEIAQKPPSKPPQPAHLDRYTSATENPRALDYLASRGVSRLEILRYDLRTAKNGPYANRILFPLTLNWKIIGFTGRAIYDFMEPRYLSHMENPGCLYIPRRIFSDRVHMPKATSPASILICEGPFDALKVAIADSDYQLFSVAILGHSLPPERIRHIAFLAQFCNNLFFCFDDDFGVSDQYALMRELRHPRIPIPQRIPLPDGINDLGEMSRGDLQKWIKNLPLNG